MFINEALPLLAGIHQAAVTDPVDPPGDPGGFPENLIHGLVCKDLLPAAGILQVGTDIFFRFRAVKVQARGPSDSWNRIYSSTGTGIPH